MALKFYAASSSDDEGIAATRSFIAAALAVGYECTLDWTVMFEDARAKFGSSVPLDVELANARADLQAVLEAHVVIFIAPGVKSEGASFELGAASALEKLGQCHVIVLDPLNRRRFFAKLPWRFAVSNDSVLAFMRGIEHGRVGVPEFDEPPTPGGDSL